MKALITGSSGLVGAACATYLAKHGFEITSLDNGARGAFFPTSGVVYDPLKLDIRNRGGVEILVRDTKPDLIVHCAAQPSHDLAASIPHIDFDTNAGGTLNLLEAARQYCPKSPFVFMSTNKVYGDFPNEYSRMESEKRFDLAILPAYPADYKWIPDPNGIAESCQIDQSKHSLFGCSKLAADILVQEYGRYFGMPTVCLRAGCLTGPQHAGVELHGFLSYLIDCNVNEREYKVFGYKGKQVRDNLHAEDVARFVLEFFHAPKTAAVYNIGGGKENSCSILEAFDMAEAVTGKTMKWKYVDEPRIGDHICYYSDLRKIESDYPGWSVTHDLPSIFREIAEAKCTAL